MMLYLLIITSSSSSLFIIIINANNYRFAVYAIANFQRVIGFIWCQSAADVKGNPRGFQSQLNTDGRDLAGLS